MRSHSLTVPVWPPAATTSSLQSKLTHSTGEVWPGRLWGVSQEQQQRALVEPDAAAGGFWLQLITHRRVHCAVSTADRPAAGGPARCLRRRSLSHQDRVGLADCPHVDLLIVAAAHEHAARLAADLQAVDAARVGGELVCGAGWGRRRARAAFAFCGSCARAARIARLRCGASL